MAWWTYLVDGTAKVGAQIFHWLAEGGAWVFGLVSNNAGAVIGTILSLLVAAFLAHSFTKSRDNMKRLRDNDTASRKIMQEKCEELLDAVQESRAWARSNHEELNLLVGKRDYPKAIELLHEISTGLDKNAFKLLHKGMVAMSFCPTGFDEHPVNLAKSAFLFLRSVPDHKAKLDDTRLDAEIRKVHALLRGSYNLELYDSLDPRSLKHRLKYGRTEERRRAYRQKAAEKIMKKLVDDIEQKTQALPVPKQGALWSESLPKGTLDQARQAADAADQSLSAWIRRAVEIKLQVDKLGPTRIPPAKRKRARALLSPLLHLKSSSRSRTRPNV
ncbi:MAG: hypothetical protein ACRC20_12270 [Segniliparus sp.]|uniref:hypothetical protein n=1 Tax=Segniliparus sp. TaxID=2804064 RepID=UPI003F368BE4